MLNGVLICSVLVAMWCSFYVGLMIGVGTIWDVISKKGAAWPLKDKPPDLWRSALLWLAGAIASLTVFVIAALNK